MGQAQVTWPEPPKPNGLIVSYTIRYQRVDLEHSKYQDICISQRHYKQYNEQYTMKLENGNYSFMVMATSLAGPGAFSAPQYISIDVSIRMFYLFVWCRLLIFDFHYLHRNQNSAIGKFSLSHWESCWR